MCAAGEPSTSTAHSMQLWTALAFSCLKILLFIFAIVHLIVHLLIVANAWSNVIRRQSEREHFHKLFFFALSFTHHYLRFYPYVLKVIFILFYGTIHRT